MIPLHKMFRIGKSIKIESTLKVEKWLPRAGQNEGKCRVQVSFWDAENILKLSSDQDCTTL